MSQTTKITAKNIQTGYQTILSSEQHGYLADEPLDAGGTGLGFRPSELLLASLSACKAMTIRFFARRQNWQLDEVEVVCSMENERTAGKTHTTISTKVTLQGTLSEEQRQKLVAVADRCPVQKILTGELHLETAIETENPAE